MPNLLYFEDLVPGRRFESGTLTVTAEAIVAFASQFDPQPFHLDPEAARDTLFKGLAASGWHTAAISMKLLTSGMMPVAGGLIGRGGEITWPRPTRPGDTLRLVCTVTEARLSESRPGMGWVRMRNETFNQNNEIVQLFEPMTPVPCRPAA